MTDPIPLAWLPEALRADCPRLLLPYVVRHEVDHTTRLGRCVLATWLAELLGMDAGATAPGWEQVDGRRWLLVSLDRHARFGEPDDTGRNLAAVPGITAERDPGVSLVMACRAVYAQQEAP